MKDRKRTILASLDALENSLLGVICKVIGYAAGYVLHKL